MAKPYKILKDKEGKSYLKIIEEDETPSKKKR